MAVLVTKPEIEIKGDGAMGLEKVAVRVTTPDVITLSESLLVRVNVASEFWANKELMNIVNNRIKDLQ